MAPCPSCSRHVRLDHAACPFCDAPLAGVTASPALSGRASRAAMVFSAVAVSMSAAACTKETIAQPYGAPPTPPDAGMTTIAQPYGAPPMPPPDAGATTIAQPYGAPPMPRDASMGAVYGAPPDLSGKDPKKPR